MKVWEREHLTQGGHREDPKKAGGRLGLTSKLSLPQACLWQESRAMRGQATGGSISSPRELQFSRDMGALAYRE